MASQQFMRQLLGGFQRAYLGSEQNTYDRLAEEREFERQQEEERIAAETEAAKQAEAAELYRKEGSIINTLLSGKKNGKDLTDQERFNIMSGLSDTGIDRLSNLSALQKKGNKYLQSGKYIYEVVDGVLTPEPVNIVPEGPVKKTKVGTKFGEHEETGEPGWATGYTDGSSSFVPAPLKKGKYANSRGEIEAITDYDPIKFKKFMDPFSRSKQWIIEQKQEWRNLFTKEAQEKLRDEINSTAFENEQTLLLAMPNDTKSHVQDYYAIMRENAAEANVSMDELQTYNQDDLQKDFAERMLKKKKAGEINSQQYRLLVLWSKFKFGYLIESAEDARITK